jgi:hypothetical protein
MAGPRTDQPTCKLYVSPLTEHLREAFAAVVASLHSGLCLQFKVGSDAYGFLRPDKLVCYFKDLADLSEFSRSVEILLADCPAHGVPFSAPLTPHGLLSWGVDPPRDGARSLSATSESWRLWISTRIAQAVIAAKRQADPATEPSRFAVTRLELAGVNTATWAPREAMWNTTSARR